MTQFLYEIYVWMSYGCSFNVKFLFHFFLSDSHCIPSLPVGDDVQRPTGGRQLHHLSPVPAVRVEARDRSRGPQVGVVIDYRGDVTLHFYRHLLSLETHLQKDGTASLWTAPGCKSRSLCNTLSASGVKQKLLGKRIYQ